MNLHINQAVPSSTNIVVSSNSLFGGNPYKTNPSLALMNLVKGKTSATTVTSSSVSHEKTTVTQEVSEVTEFKIDVLPIDAHRDDILRRINKDRVVIIHGETG
jgi:HrpA-like RNA helicase